MPLDFTAAAFDGTARYVQISVKKPADAGYTDLTPRQQVTSTPYAIRSLNAGSVESTTAGSSVVNAINNASTATTINSNRLSADVVRMKPAAAQTSASHERGANAAAGVSGNTGCDLASGSGAFVCSSSRTIKQNFLNVRGEDVLSRIRELPMTTWNYTLEGANARHIGPVAEDFYNAFRFGTSDKSIAIQDLAGVSLVAAKALEQRTAELQAENNRLHGQVAVQNERLAAQQTQLNEFEARLKQLEQSNATTRRTVRSGNRR